MVLSPSPDITSYLSCLVGIDSANARHGPLDKGIIPVSQFHFPYQVPGTFVALVKTVPVSARRVVQLLARKPGSTGTDDGAS